MYIPKVLSIAGSDSGGGAGIQADLKTTTSLGCFGMTVLTAVTAQNTLGVDQIAQLSESMIAAQFNAVAQDFKIDAIKIGMIGNSITVQLLSKLLGFDRENIVFDPVMVATSGALLAENQIQLSMTNLLFPISRLITPNLNEAQIFLNSSSIESSQMVDAANELLKLGANAVLLKGGHLSQEQLKDVLVEKNGQHIEVTEFHHPRILTENTHGTGCTLSSAIACGLAQKHSLKLAVKNGIDYTQEAILAASRISDKQLGQGHGALWHAFQQFPIV
jgi:hydroxymethylpyrimidine/phosphomethylpyrimidine kinase